MALALPDARELSHDVLEALRLRAVRGCQLGFTEGHVADLLGVARETVCRCWSAYAGRGVAALPQRRSGLYDETSSDWEGGRRRRTERLG
jgi:hypothetical protein